MESVLKLQKTGSETDDGLKMPGQNADKIVMEVQQVSPFPDEILEMMFKHLKHPQDIINISKACSNFANIVAATKSIWLFSEVFPIIFPDLDKPSVYNCRLVCKMWKEAVQNAIDNYHTDRPYDPVVDLRLTPATRIYHKRLRTGYREKNFSKFNIGPDFWKRSKDAKWWLDTMSGHQGNPFVSKYIKTCNADYNPKSGYWKNNMKFLRTYGQYILHFQMLFQERSTDYLGFYQILRRCLQLMPNLKSLILTRSYDTLDSIKKLKNLWHYELKKYIRKFPLPEHSNLCSLYVVIEDFNFTASQELIVVELFRRYQKQLRKVKVDPDWCCEVPILKKYFGLANNLTDLQLTVNSDFDIKVGCSGIEAFLTRVPALPNLAKLRIKFSYSTNGHDLQVIMESLTKFPKLRVLSFLFHFRQEIHEDKMEMLHPKVQLPSVKILDVHLRSFYDHFYDALLCYLPCLEYLHLHHLKRYQRGGCSYEIGEDGDNIYEVFKGLSSSDMYKSKVWKKIKTLKEITCTHFSILSEDAHHKDEDWDKLFRFTRERYELLNGNPQTN